MKIRYIEITGPKLQRSISDFCCLSEEYWRFWYWQYTRRKFNLILYDSAKRFAVENNFWHSSHVSNHGWWMTVFTVGIFLPFIEREGLAWRNKKRQRCYLSCFLDFLKADFWLPRPDWARHFKAYSYRLEPVFCQMLSKELAKTHLRPIRYAAMMILAWLLQNWIFTSLIYFPFRVKAHRLCIAHAIWKLQWP